MTDIKWGDPPFATKGAGSGKYVPLLDAVRSRPGEWACIGRHSASIATSIKRGITQGARPGEFEATSRNQSGGKADIYVRYVGDQNGADR